MGLHFVQVAFALIVAGAAVLIVAGLVIESLHDKGRHIHLFPDAHDRDEIPIADVPETALSFTPDTGPFSQAPADDTGRTKRGPDGKDRAERKRRKEKRRNGKNRDTAAREESGGRTTAAETERA